jgi:hypothetical protein
LRYSGKQVTVARVVLKENIVVPANHEVVFPAYIDLETNPGDYEGDIEPSTSFIQKISLLVGRALAVSSELHTPVRLLNLSNQDVKLYKGMHIGTFSPIEHIHMRCRDDVTNVHMVSTESNSWKEKLSDSPFLNEDQRRELLNLLRDFESVFLNHQPTMGKLL